MQVKVFEIRDRGTFIPVVAILMRPLSRNPEEAETERYLLRRSGFGEDPLVMLVKMQANGLCAHEASYDPYGWGPARTMQVAHDYIQQHWGVLQSGEVIDVEYILGLTPSPKQSERHTHAI